MFGRHRSEAHGGRLAKVVTPAAKRDAVAHLCNAHKVSQRRACSVLGVDRSSVRYRSVRPDDSGLRKAMKDVANERRRFGYRRVHVMLEHQGWLVNSYPADDAQHRRKGRRRSGGSTRKRNCR